METNTICRYRNTITAFAFGGMKFVTTCGAVATDHGLCQQHAYDRDEAAAGRRIYDRPTVEVFALRPVSAPKLYPVKTATGSVRMVSVPPNDPAAEGAAAARLDDETRDIKAKMDALLGACKLALAKGSFKAWDERVLLAAIALAEGGAL